MLSVEEIKSSKPIQILTKPCILPETNKTNTQQRMRVDNVNRTWIELKSVVIWIINVNPLTARHFFFTLSFGAGQIFSFLIPGAG